MNNLNDKELNAIAFLVEEGFTRGSIDGVNWEISFEKHDWDNEEDNYKIIGNHIRNRKTMGYYPSWQLEAENE